MTHMSVFRLRFMNYCRLIWSPRHANGNVGGTVRADRFLDILTNFMLRRQSSAEHQSVDAESD